MNISQTIRAVLIICLSLSIFILLAESKPLKFKNSNQENAVLENNQQNPALKKNLLRSKSALSAKSLVPSAKSRAMSATSLSRSPASALALAPSAAASTPSKSAAPANFDDVDNIRKILKEIVERIMANQINAEVIGKDGENSIELDSHPIPSFSTTASTGSAAASPKDPILSRIWDDLKRDIAWETETMKEEFEKLEDAIFRRVQSFINTQDDYDDDDNDDNDDSVKTAISTSKLALQRDQHSGLLGKQQREKDDEKDGEEKRQRPQQPQRQKEDADTQRVIRHVNHRLPPTLPAEMGQFIEKKARKKEAKGRGKRNLLTDLISPHMRWDEGTGGGSGTKLTYQQFTTISKQLIFQLKIDRELVDGAEQETADAIISALEELLAGDEAFVTALLQS